MHVQYICISVRKQQGCAAASTVEHPDIYNCQQQSRVYREEKRREESSIHICASVSNYLEDVPRGREASSPAVGAYPRQKALGRGRGGG